MNVEAFLRREFVERPLEFEATVKDATDGSSPEIFVVLMSWILLVIGFFLAGFSFFEVGVFFADICSLTLDVLAATGEATLTALCSLLGCASILVVLCMSAVISGNSAAKRDARFRAVDEAIDKL